MIGSPSIERGAAVVLMDSGSVKAFSAQGTPLWTYAARGRLSPHITRSPDGMIYIARTNGTFIALNQMGRELWRTELPVPLSGPVVCGWDGRIFVPAENRIFCLTASGHLLWEQDLGSSMVIPPQPDLDGGLVTVLSDAVLLRLGPFGGAQLLYLSAIPQAIIPLGPAGKGGRTLIVYPNGGLEFSDLRSADFDRGPIPLPRLEGRPLSAAAWGLRAAVLFEGGRLQELNALTGELLWTVDSGVADTSAADTSAADTSAADTSAADTSALIYDERGIYALSKTRAAGFTPEGRMIWRLDLQGAASVPGFGDDGILYSGGTDWILYAFRQEDRVRQQAQSVFGSLAEGSYGTGNPPPSSWGTHPLRWEEATVEGELALIRQAVLGGRVGNHELEYTAYLMETANAGQDLGSLRPRPLVHISHRVRALQLLGIIGSRETIPFLTRIFTQDQDSVIRATAAEAIGAIGMDPDGIALNAFSNAARSVVLREEQVLAAMAVATGALCRFSGPPVMDEGIRILSSLSTRSRPLFVQTIAKQELESLRK
jgi:outer membrane protein assembly factor BamB